MTKARDLANIISGGFTTADLPTLTASEIPNLDASKITTGSIADARVPASAVSQHASSFDDNKIVNDISTLAIRQASNENKGSYNTNSMFVDVFQDGTGIASHTTAPRNSDEYVSTIVAGALNNSYSDFGTANYGTVSNWSWSGNDLTIGTSPDNDDGKSSGTGSTPITFGANKVFRFRAGPHTNSTGNNPWIAFTKTSSDTRAANVDAAGELYWNINSGSTARGFHAYDAGSMEKKVDQNFGTSGYYFGLSRDSAGILRAYHKTGSAVDFSETPIYTFSTNYSANVYYLLLSGTGGHQGVLNDIQYDIGTAQVVNASGNFISNAITAPSSTNKMGAIITYQDNAGTNTLNTDIVLQLSADGTNFTTATMTALPDFATGIKMAKVNDLSVTAGTSLKYKISFANQSAGSKEARIRGVSLQY